ncbi:MAG: hypothetical protein JXQ68_04695 [Campylobacterales bacterium]|nr:hypothetical protein [Campylobacterales bacterium]
MKKHFKSIFLTLFLPSSIYAIDSVHPSLFVAVVGVAEDDVLNIRQEPDYHSPKVGSQVPNAYMAVDWCVEVEGATWCRVYEVAQYNYSEDFRPGWVNARFLKPNNKGYVSIDGKRNCDYVIGCEADKCEVIASYEDDENLSITNIKTEWIERSRLKGESHFSAMPDGADGYCNIHQFIDDYLKKEGR